jgi:hypothetical protein
MGKKGIVLLLLLCGCSKSVVIDMPKTRAADTTEYIPIERNDTTETSGVPVTFDVSVEGWEDTEIDINL